MSQLTVPERSWFIVLSRDHETSSQRAELRLRVRSGELTRVARGAYLDTLAWTSCDRDARHRVLVTAAAALSSERLTFSHAAAAALWRLPWIGAWPSRVDALADAVHGGNSTKLIQRHAPASLVMPERIDGHNVTALPVTVVDLAALLPFDSAVAVADAALRRATHPLPGLPRVAIDHEALRAELQRIPLNHGRARAARVIEFADGRADRPGESLSRVAMKRARLPMPELQVPLRGASGRVYVVDFWWEQFRVFGEFDGRFKYSNPEFLRGRTPQQALYDEKLREDDLRALDRRCARWNWEVARSIPLLRERLAAAGVR